MNEGESALLTSPSATVLFYVTMPVCQLPRPSPARVFSRVSLYSQAQVSARPIVISDARGRIEVDLNSNLNLSLWREKDGARQQTHHVPKA